MCLRTNLRNYDAVDLIVQTRRRLIKRLVQHQSLLKNGPSFAGSPTTLPIDTTRRRVVPFESSRTTRDAARPRFRRLIDHTFVDLSEFPCFRQRLADVRVNVGRHISLEVRVAGFPDCELTWYKDDAPLGRYRPANLELRQYSRELYVLYIHAATVADSGIYTCMAYNTAGAVRTSAYVHVEPYRGPVLDVKLTKC